MRWRRFLLPHRRNTAACDFVYPSRESAGAQLEVSAAHAGPTRSGRSVQVPGSRELLVVPDTVSVRPPRIRNLTFSTMVCWPHSAKPGRFPPTVWSPPKVEFRLCVRRKHSRVAPELEPRVLVGDDQVWRADAPFVHTGRACCDQCPLECPSQGCMLPAVLDNGLQHLERHLEGVLTWPLACERPNLRTAVYAEPFRARNPVESHYPLETKEARVPFSLRPACRQSPRTRPFHVYITIYAGPERPLYLQAP